MISSRRTKADRESTRQVSWVELGEDIHGSIPER